MSRRRRKIFYKLRRREHGPARCHYCGMLLGLRGMTRDHVIPRSLGGPGYLWNLVPSCKTCNARKGDREYERFTGRPLPTFVVEGAGVKSTAEWKAKFLS